MLLKEVETGGLYFSFDSPLNGKRITIKGFSFEQLADKLLEHEDLQDWAKDWSKENIIKAFDLKG